MQHCVVTGQNAALCCNDYQHFLLYPQCFLKASLSHNNPCFQCTIDIPNFLVSYTCEIRFNDVIDCTVNLFTSWHHSMQKFQNMAKWVCFRPFFFNLICLIQLWDKKNLTFVDCCDKILWNLSWKRLLSSPKACLITFSKTHLIKFHLDS